MYIDNMLDTPIPDKIHMTGANTNIRRTMTPYSNRERERRGEGEKVTTAQLIQCNNDNLKALSTKTAISAIPRQKH
jgi:hypothetical protein